MFDSIHWHVYGLRGVVDEVTGFGIIGKILASMEVTPSTVIVVAAISYVLLIIAAYFLGNISPSTILAKRQGLDIKKEGSGNAGTTNALRVMGKKAGIITLVIDILKGVLAVLLAEILAGEVCGMYCAVAVIIGHVWPAIYKFKGGKGVATTFGALVAINPMLGLWTLLVVAVVTFLSKRMSAGSISGAICFPIICLFNEPEFIVQGALLAIIVLVKHRANIVRLLEGEEPKLGFLDKDKKNADEEAEGEAIEEAEMSAEPADEPEESAAELTEEPEIEQKDVQEITVEETVKEASAEEDSEVQEEEQEAEVTEETEIVSEEPAEEKTIEEEKPATEEKPEKYKRPAVDKNTKKNGKKKKSYPNKNKNSGNKSKGKGKNGKSKKKGGKKK